jgi:hypothetical protein
MPIYQVTPLAKNTDLVRSAIEKHTIEADRFEIPNEAGWFVRFGGTTVELSHKLEITGQPQGIPTPVGSTLITHIVAYYGRGGTDMWEWLKTRFESQA